MTDTPTKDARARRRLIAGRNAHGAQRGREAMMIARGTLNILIVVAMAAWGLGLEAQSPDRGSAALQAAIRLELIEGNLKAAMQEYSRLAEGSEPAVAAEALIRLAAGHEKFGEPADARRAYERVVREHAGQTRWAAQARTWLAAHPAPPAGGVRAELLWSGRDANAVLASLSPDGRYLSLDDWSGPVGNLAVRELQTGQTRLLTRDATWEGFVAESLFSPDGRQIAYVWQESDVWSVRLIGADGTRMRELTRQPVGTHVRAWSPDGRYLAASQFSYDDHTSRSVLISTADGSVVPLKSTGKRSLGIGGFSPDGRFLLYSFRKGTNEATGGIYALATDLSVETTLIEDAASYMHAVWSPDGRYVVFVSDRTGTNKLYALRVVDGRPQGKPEPLPANVSTLVRNLGFSREGVFHFATLTTHTEAYLGRLDPSTLKVSDVAPINDRFVGRHFQPDLSPDGRYVAFLRRTTERVNGGPADLVVRTLATNEERTVAKLEVTYTGDRSVQWFPDSRTVLLQESIFSPSPGVKKFRAINVETGADRLLFEGPYTIWRTAALSPDGAWLFYSKWDAIPPTQTGTLRLIKRHLETGQETELYQVETDGIGCFGLTVSPDGQRLACSVNVGVDERVLFVMSTNGGPVSEIYRGGYRTISASGAMAFMPDSRRLVFRGLCDPTPAPVARGEEPPQSWCAAPVDGGSIRPLESVVSERNVSHPMISADGRRVAFTAGSNHGEVWAIHNLLPRPAAAAR